MKLFKIIEGAYLGFYKERGGTVFISGYRTAKTREWVCEMVTEEYKEPDKEQFVREWVPEHQLVVHTLVEGHYETKTRVVPEHYEKKTETVPSHYGTREYWIVPRIETRYRFVGTEEQRAGRYGWELVAGESVFVGTEEQRGGRAGWESYEVEIPGYYEDRRVWFHETTRTYDVLVPEHVEEYKDWIPRHYVQVDTTIEGYWWEEWKYIPGETVTKEHEVCHWVDVEVDQPIYSYYGEYDEYDLIGRERGPAYVIVGPPEGDKLKLRIIESGDIIEVEAEYLGIGTRTDDNEYVLPGQKLP